MATCCMRWLSWANFAPFSCISIEKQCLQLCETLQIHPTTSTCNLSETLTNSPYFPLSRHFSWFDGHSFASGVFVLDGGKSQESVSEAINAYYAVHLLGVALQHDALADFGRLLASMEIQAAKLYWQMPNSSIYDPVYAQNRMTGKKYLLQLTRQAKSRVPRSCIRHGSARSSRTCISSI